MKIKAKQDTTFTLIILLKNPHTQTHNNDHKQNQFYVTKIKAKHDFDHPVGTKLTKYTIIKRTTENNIKNNHKKAIFSLILLLYVPN